MKKQVTNVLLGLFSIMVIGLAACNNNPTQNEIVKKNAEEYVKSKLNDPSSFEFADLILVDSITYLDNINYRKEGFVKDIESGKANIESQEKYKTDMPSMYNEKTIPDLKETVKKNEKILSVIDSLETALGERKNEATSYTYTYSFRSKNALGAKVLNEYILQTDAAPSFKIINMTDDKDKVILNPNDFPGYREAVSKILL